MGVLLIIDKIVTGFRLRLGRAQECFSIKPDLSVFAKGISNGVPLSCYVGWSDVMDTVEKVVISSSFGVIRSGWQLRRQFSRFMKTKMLSKRPGPAVISFTQDSMLIASTLTFRLVFKDAPFRTTRL